MELSKIYQPIEKDLNGIELVLRNSLAESKNKSIQKVSHFLWEPLGKRLRPALVILSARVTNRAIKSSYLLNLASAVELIHIASLLHDDIIDHSQKRHNKETINKKFGTDIAIALGDYLYSRAFELASSCRSNDILSCISRATRLMCEGELLQVCERGNPDLLKERYIVIVKKKTAALFSASCQTGTMLADRDSAYKDVLADYGLNFGIAFQIVDDCLDIIGEERDLGKSAGADFNVGELTLPVLNLLSLSKDKSRLISLFRQRGKQESFVDLRQRFINSPAMAKTKEDASLYLGKAKECINRLTDSCFKQSLLELADFIMQRLLIFSGSVKKKMKETTRQSSAEV